MTVAHWFLGGIIIGIILFFVLERKGVVYDWFDRWDA